MVSGQGRGTPDLGAPLADARQRVARRRDELKAIIADAPAVAGRVTELEAIAAGQQARADAQQVQLDAIARSLDAAFTVAGETPPAGLTEPPRRPALRVIEGGAA